MSTCMALPRPPDVRRIALEEARPSAVDGEVREELRQTSAPSLIRFWLDNV